MHTANVNFMEKGNKNALAQKKGTVDFLFSMQWKVLKKVLWSASQKKKFISLEK